MTSIPRPQLVAGSSGPGAVLPSSQGTFPVPHSYPNPKYPHLTAGTAQRWPVTLWPRAGDLFQEAAPDQPETHAEKVLVRRVGSGLGTTLPRRGDGERSRARWVSSSPTAASWVGGWAGGGGSDDMADLERDEVLRGHPLQEWPPHASHPIRESAT